MNDLIKIRGRIKDLREFSDYSLEDFAAKLNMSAKEYEDYENGTKDIPIGLLYNIATALQIDPSVILFGQSPTKRYVSVVYAGKGTEIERFKGYSFLSLNSDFIDPNLEPMLVTIKEGVTPELVQHKGQEFNYVLEGSLRVIVGEKEYYLKTGDSIYFDATLPHAQIAMEKEARFLTVIQK
ncbi:MAG: helix-turn-helix transcriptional regulator [Clostridiales bacterium]|nr:helix-turn-helix transcriptional regulator [Clostridiales bacterium]HOB64784.1 XRE family transcriptional regulator [Clostridia bacterium]HOK82092.1 XRE family transcriptional regulator [Clostridia bacterium]HOL61032.1 XRE family transcriptional regulator [Clostridia bacterium]HPO53944.1 XRE family transcriptional regulator [Clostridia bacterium]